MSDEQFKVVEVLDSGGVVIFPTDTAYGIGCRFDKENAVRRVFELRRRPEEKALIALVSSLEMAREYVFFDKKTETDLLSKYWPGGLTVILPCKKEKVPSIVRAGGETLAVRLPDHKELLEIIDKVGVPIVAPSANFSGDKTPFRLSDVNEKLKAQVDFVLSGVCTMEGVSTVVDAASYPWKVIREGVVKLDL